MLLTVSTTHTPATDLGYLLHKHPARVQSFPQSAGVAHVFYPEATEERCTAALLLEVDPIGLVRGRKNNADGFTLDQYVNDRPYAASSLFARALKDVFSTAMTGRCASRQELADSAIPLEITVPALPCRGGESLLRRMLEPLGWTITGEVVPLDREIPEWGDSRYMAVTLRGTLRLADALRQLYVLLPVLDDGKHYWVGDDEIDKLIRAGEGWLAAHPERETITRRYLAHRQKLTRTALDRLADIDDTEPETLDAEVAAEADVQTAAARSAPLAQLRRAAVLAVLRDSGAITVGDLGCGEGALVADLLAERWLRRIVAADVSARSLQLAARRLRLDRLSEPERDRLDIFQSSLTYRDDRLTGLDAAVLMEVIEHVDPPRLPALARTVFGHAAPRTVIVTTPNAEHNVRYETLPAGTLRHRDHRFEWTRAEFRAWAEDVAAAYRYSVRFLPVGPDDAEVGPPTQLAVFTSNSGVTA